MTKKQEKIIKAVLVAFEIVWGESFFPEDIGTEKYYTFKRKTYCMYPDDYEVLMDLIKEFEK